jgi:tRNA A37 methylthiotransferase MiaB
MTKMFDPGYTPYDLLEKLAEHQKAINKNHEQIIQGMMQQRDALNQVIEQLNQNTEMINSLNLQIQGLHDRIILLEMVRQYEDSNKNEQH